MARNTSTNTAAVEPTTNIEDPDAAVDPSVDHVTDSVDPAEPTTEVVETEEEKAKRLADEQAAKEQAEADAAEAARQTAEADARAAEARAQTVGEIEDAIHRLRRLVRTVDGSDEGLPFKNPHISVANDHLNDFDVVLHQAVVA